MGRVIFTDAIGSATLDNGLGVAGEGLAARFRGWTPFQRPIGPAKTALGTGARYQFAFRTDYGAAFSVAEIPETTVPVALRLMAHLLNGGTVRVETEDAQNRIYTSCGLAPDAEPTLELADPGHRLYRLALALINLGTAAPLLCEYTEFAVPGTVLLLAGPDRLDGLVFSRASTATYATPA